MEQIKFYLKYLVVLVFTISIISCTSKNEEKGDDQTKQASKAKVYPVVSSEAASGKKAADFTWRQDGKQVRFSDYTKGKFVLLNFWGTWCPPCRKEIPDIISIAKEMESKGLIVMGAAMERSESINENIDVVSAFWNNNQMYYPIVISTPDLANAYGGIDAVPTTFLINDKGEIVDTLVGLQTKESFMASIDKMMKAKS